MVSFLPDCPGPIPDAASTTVVRHLTLHAALSGMALPLHPGAERYFQQSGIAAC